MADDSQAGVLLVGITPLLMHSMDHNPYPPPAGLEKTGRLIRLAKRDLLGNTYNDEKDAALWAWQHSHMTVGGEFCIPSDAVCHCLRDTITGLSKYCGKIGWNVQSFNTTLGPQITPKGPLLIGRKSWDEISVMNARIPYAESRSPSAHMTSTTTVRPQFNNWSISFKIAWRKAPASLVLDLLKDAGTMTGLLDYRPGMDGNCDRHGFADPPPQSKIGRGKGGSYGMFEVRIFDLHR